jgi:hypothetical protein
MNTTIVPPSLDALNAVPPKAGFSIGSVESPAPTCLDSSKVDEAFAAFWQNASHAQRRRFFQLLDEVSAGRLAVAETPAALKPLAACAAAMLVHGRPREVACRLRAAWIAYGERD